MGLCDLQSKVRLSRGGGLFALLVVLLALAAFVDSKVSGGVSSDKWAAAECEGWDHDAVDGLIPLMYSSSAAAELKLNEGLAQLRRARAYCRSGSVVVARNDYRSLHGAFPVTTATLRDPLNSKSKSGPISIKD